jgi:hypothetical protein
MLGITDILDLSERFKVVDKVKNLYKKITKKDKQEHPTDEQHEGHHHEYHHPKIIIDEDIPYGNLDKRLEIYTKILGENGIARCDEYGDKHSPLKMVIVDDLETIVSYYINLLEQYSKRYDVDIFKNYHVLLFTGDKCGYRAYKYIMENKIQLALLDITLNQSIKYQLGDDTYYMTIDGPDIASLISNKYPDVRYMFNTAHRISDDNTILQKYLIKIKAICNKHMLDYNRLFINKDSTNIIDAINSYLANNRRSEDG